MTRKFYVGLLISIVLMVVLMLVYFGPLDTIPQVMVTETGTPLFPTGEFLFLPIETHLPIASISAGTVTPMGVIQPAIPETRQLTLEWPSAIQVGASDTIRLILEVDTQGSLTPTMEIAGHPTRGETIIIPDLYKTHNVIAESRLDMAGVKVAPSGSINEPLLPGKTAIFFWSVSPVSAGNFSGTVWLHLRFYPLNGGEEQRIAVSAQVIEIRGITLFGLEARPARILGVIGSVVGTVLGLPFLEDGFRWLSKRRLGATSEDHA